MLGAPWGAVCGSGLTEIFGVLSSTPFTPRPTLAPKDSETPFGREYALNYQKDLEAQKPRMLKSGSSINLSLPTSRSGEFSSKPSL